MKGIPNELAPCGVFCGACPSFNTTCLGCPSESREQKRTSKWGCKIRMCCYEDKKIDFCCFCSEFPCKKIKKKLLDSHPGEIKFRYRHEIPKNMDILKEMDRMDYLNYQKQRWSCPSCNGTVRFYHYRCDICGREIII